MIHLFCFIPNILRIAFAFFVLFKAALHAQPAYFSPYTTQNPSATLNVEVAITPQQLQWGLMGRKEMAWNSGMLFILPQKQQLSVWMFNCYFDLDIAFCDENGVILKIGQLKAYPHMMDPRRPVNDLSDLALYPLSDPIRSFYARFSLYSDQPVKSFLEVNKGWLASYGIKEGDQVVDQGSGLLHIIPCS